MYLHRAELAEVGERGCGRRLELEVIGLGGEGGERQNEGEKESEHRLGEYQNPRNPRAALRGMSLAYGPRQAITI
jgi:hypothetical protein